MGVREVIWEKAAGVLVVSIMGGGQQWLVLARLVGETRVWSGSSLVLLVVVVKRDGFLSPYERTLFRRGVLVKDVVLHWRWRNDGGLVTTKVLR